MSENGQSTCYMCGNECDVGVFHIELTEFFAGRLVRFIQGNRRLSGRIGRIVRPEGTFAPGRFVVMDLTTNIEHIIRFDHMMLNDRINTDQHYNELYNGRLVSDKYEYEAPVYPLRRSQ